MIRNICLVAMLFAAGPAQASWWASISNAAQRLLNYQTSTLQTVGITTAIVGTAAYLYHSYQTGMLNKKIKEYAGKIAELKKQLPCPTCTSKHGLRDLNEINKAANAIEKSANEIEQRTKRERFHPAITIKNPCPQDPQAADDVSQAWNTKKSFDKK